MVTKAQGKGTVVALAEKLIAGTNKHLATTRAARHTMGSQQRKGVKGAVTGVVITPITASRPSVPVPAPSPNPPAASTGATTGTAPHITA